MVYNYNTNREFIDVSHDLLEKLDRNNLWNKDTLIIGLDKSVRPLVYTLKKMSNLEKRESPNIKFFNYSHYDDPSSSDSKIISSHLKKLINPRELLKYKKIAILDEYAVSGESLKNTKDIIQSLFLNSKDKPKIYLTSLGILDEEHLRLGKNNLIFVEEDRTKKASKYETGIRDKYRTWVKLGKRSMQESIRIRNKRDYKEFSINRKQLSKDIKEYINERQDVFDNKTEGHLEKIAQTLSILFLIFGIIFSSLKMTGNVIGISSNSSVIGIVLIFLGIIGLFLSRKFKR